MSQRPAIIRIEEAAGDDLARVTIVLDWNDESYLGTAAGQAEGRHRPRLVGEAALRAVEAVTGGSLRLELVAVATAEVGDVHVAMTQVRVSGSGESLVGTALLEEEDRSWATARAVLDAINRRLTFVLERTGD